MSRCKCDWSAEHGEDEFKRITLPTAEECEQIAMKFRPYLIVKTVDRRERKVYCTRCGQEAMEVKPNWSRLRHGEVAQCPYCGWGAEVAHAGKMGYSCKKMRETVQAVVFHAEDNGWLSAQAVYAIRDYRGKNWDVHENTEYGVTKQYLFRPGCALARIQNWVRGAWKFTKAVTVYEPFTANMNDYWTGIEHRQYTVVGLKENLPKTEMRYSAADLFAEKIRGNFGLLRYLGEYCHRPQLEFLVKLGIDDVVDQLIYWRLAHTELLDWRANDLASFLRLDKQYTKHYMKTNKTIKELEVLQAMQKSGKYDAEVADYLASADELEIRKLQKVAVEQSITKAVRYLIKHGKNALHLWTDYMDMAKKLRYDLSEETVMYPKNLEERHDIAAAAIEVIEDTAKARRMKRRTKVLKERYEYSDSEFAIVVPETIHAIIKEGREQHHCVGSYAEQHCDGKTTILFLRRLSAMNEAYGTIEMSVTDPAKLIQLRGHRNCDTPRRESKDFIDRWLSWVRCGSPRNTQGQPVDATIMEVIA